MIESPKNTVHYFNSEITFKLWEVFDLENPDANVDRKFQKEGDVYFIDARYEHHGAEVFKG